MAFEVTAYRMAIFFFILLIGFVAGRADIIKNDYMPQLAQLITKVLLPVLTFYNTVAYTTCDDIIANWFVLVLSLVFYVVLAVLLFALAKVMRLEGDRDKVFTFCFLFGNTGFVGIPLLVALFPETGMLYMMLFSLVDQAPLSTFRLNRTACP